MEELDLYFVRERRKIINRTICSSFPSQTKSQVLPFPLRNASKVLLFHNKPQSRTNLLPYPLQTTKKEYMVETLMLFSQSKRNLQKKI